MSTPTKWGLSAGYRAPQRKTEGSATATERGHRATEEGGAPGNQGRASLPVVVCVPKPNGPLQGQAQPELWEGRWGVSLRAPGGRRRALTWLIGAPPPGGRLPVHGPEGRPSRQKADRRPLCETVFSQSSATASRFPAGSLLVSSRSASPGGEAWGFSHQCWVGDISDLKRTPLLMSSHKNNELCLSF